MMRLMQTGCLMIGILCLLYYGIIVIYAGIKADFAWFWAVVALLLFAVCVALGKEGMAAHWFARIVLGLLLLGFLTSLVMGAGILRGIMAKPQKHLDYVIVLGAQVRGEVPSLALQKRLNCAAEYAKENPETVFLLSGGQGSGESITEAEAMRRYLTAAGVDEKRLLLESRSTSTRENLLFCSEMIDVKDRKVGILSNDFHVYRAGIIAGKLGYKHTSLIPAPSDIWMQPHYIVREVCALLKEAIHS